MADREKVIANLTRCQHCLCDECDLEHASHYPWDCEAQDQLINDALELLKAQEEKAGTWQWKIHGKPESGGTLGEAICDQCGKSTFSTAVHGNLNYCPNCGAKMCKG